MSWCALPCGAGASARRGGSPPRLRRVGLTRHAPPRRQLLALPRLRAAARGRPSRCGRGRARPQRVLRRGSAALGGDASRLDICPPPGYRTHPAAALPGACTRSARRRASAARAFLATVRAGCAVGRLVARRAARPVIPGDAVRLDRRALHRRGVGERRPAEQRWETFVARDVVQCSRRAAIAIALRHARAPRGGLSEGGYGALNIGLHHPRRVPGARELVGLRARRRHRLNVRAPRRALLAREQLRRHWPKAAPGAAAAHTFLWFCSAAPDDQFLHAERGVRPARWAARHPAPVLPRPRRPQLGALAWQRGARAPRGVTEHSARVELGRGAGCLLIAVALRRGGWYLAATPCRAARSARRVLPLDELSRAPPCRCSWFVGRSGVRPALLLGLYRALGADRAGPTAAAARSRRGRASRTSRPGISIADRPSDRPATTHSDAAAGRQAVYTPPRRRRRGGARTDGAACGTRAPLVVATRSSRQARRSTCCTRSAPGADSGLLALAAPERVVRPRSGGRRLVAPLGRRRGPRLADARRAWQVGPRALRAARRSLHASCTASTTARLPRPRLASCSPAVTRLRRPGDTATAAAARRRPMLRRRRRDRRLRRTVGALAQPDGGRPAVHACASPPRDDAGGSPRDARRARRHLVRRLRQLVPALALHRSASSRPPGCVAAWLAPWRHRVVRQAERERGGSRARSCRLGRGHACRRSCCGPTSRTSSPTTSARSSRTASSAASRSSRAILIGPRDRRTDALVGALRRARARAATGDVAILGASGALRCRALRAEHSASHALYHGDEAVRRHGVVLARRPADPQGAPVGPPARTRRLHASALSPDARSGRSCATSSRRSPRAWRGAEPERGFVMALDALVPARATRTRCSWSAAIPTARLSGFLHFAVSPSRRPRRSLVDAAAADDAERVQRVARSAPTLTWARDAGAPSASSLNFAPFAALLAPGGRAERRCSSCSDARCLRLRGTSSSTTCSLFNRKFFPRWERRFVVYERRRDLPRVGIAAPRGRGVPAVPERARDELWQPVSYCARVGVRTQLGLAGPARGGERRCRRSSLRAPAQFAAALLGGSRSRWARGLLAGVGG